MWQRRKSVEPVSISRECCRREKAVAATAASSSLTSSSPYLTPPCPLYPLQRLQLLSLSSSSPSTLSSTLTFFVGPLHHTSSPSTSSCSTGLRFHQVTRHFDKIVVVLREMVWISETDRMIINGWWRAAIIVSACSCCTATAHNPGLHCHCCFHHIVSCGKARGGGTTE